MPQPSQTRSVVIGELLLVNGSRLIGYPAYISSTSRETGLTMVRSVLGAQSIGKYAY